MIIFLNFSPGGRWWIGPLITIGLSLASWVPQLISEWIYYRQRQPQRRRQQHHVEEQSGFVLDVIDIVLVLVLIGLIVKAVHMLRQRGGARNLFQQWQLQWQRQQQAAAQRAGQQQGRHAARRPDFDRVVAALQKLPTEVVATREDLEKESVHELKERLAKLHVECTGCLEKRELVAKALDAAGGSSGESCAICAEEYAPGDVVRVLPCKHRMHVECIDRWLLKSTDHSAPKGCPLCNDESWLR